LLVQHQPPPRARAIRFKLQGLMIPLWEWRTVYNAWRLYKPPSNQLCDSIFKQNWFKSHHKLTNNECDGTGYVLWWKMRVLYLSPRLLVCFKDLSSFFAPPWRFWHVYENRNHQLERPSSSFSRSSLCGYT
jgi:hypothetical protein